MIHYNTDCCVQDTEQLYLLLDNALNPDRFLNSIDEIVYQTRIARNCGGVSYTRSVVCSV